MRILRFEVADFPPVAASFSWEGKGFQFFGWKLLRGRDGQFFLGPPRFKNYAKGEITAALADSVKLPGPTYNQLLDIVVEEYSRSRGREDRPGVVSMATPKASF